MFGLRLIEVAMIVVGVVLPMITDTWEASVTLRVPLRFSCRIVGTSVPVMSGDVTLNGSVRQGNAATFVTLQTRARPPAPIVVVKMSGCAGTIVNLPRMTEPL